MATLLKSPVTAEDHIQGRPNASIVLIEYGDYQCPACGHAYPIIKQVQRHFGKELAFVFRNFPLTEIHPLAEIAAETAEFAADYNKFWEMHDLIYENQPALSRITLIELATALKLPLTEFEIALQNGTYQAKVKRDFMSGIRSGVNGTPTFFINEVRHNGSFEYESLVMAIDHAIEA